MSLYVDIEKSLGDFQLKVKFSAENELLSLFGASGCGKSMTLKCIAGIEKPDKGKIILDGVTLFDSEKHINLAPQKRNTGLLFQDYALFPNMTVYQNLMCGAHKEPSPNAKKEAIEKIADTFRIRELFSHYPHQLSGGQAQRVALARILLSKPNILLLDEPFSALDSHLHFKLEQELHHLRKHFNKTIVFVSHDFEEVYRLSSHVAVMNQGHIEVINAPKELFEQPKTYAAALLTGCKNISPAVSVDKLHIRATDWNVTFKSLPMAEKYDYIGIRMKDIQYGSGLNNFSCKVTEVWENPYSFSLKLRPRSAKSDIYLNWEVDKKLWESIKKEDTITVNIPPEAILLLKGS